MNLIVSEYGGNSKYEDDSWNAQGSLQRLPVFPLPGLHVSQSYKKKTTQHSEGKPGLSHLSVS